MLTSQRSKQILTSPAMNVMLGCSLDRVYCSAGYSIPYYPYDPRYNMTIKHYHTDIWRKIHWMYLYLCVIFIFYFHPPILSRQYICHPRIQDCRPPWERAGTGAGPTTETAAATAATARRPPRLRVAGKWCCHDGLTSEITALTKSNIIRLVLYDVIYLYVHMYST